MNKRVSDAAKQLMAYREDFIFYSPRALRIRPKAPDNVTMMRPAQLGTIPLVLNKAQMYLHTRIEQQRAETGKVRVLGLKGRQQGFSTYIEGRFYWKTTGTFGCKTQILTHEQDATDNLFDMVRRFHEHCPAALRPHTGKANAKELAFDVLDSRYSVSTAGTRNAGRSSTAQLFHGSEAAFWPNDSEHMAGMGQTVADAYGTEIILETTGNGQDNMFYAMWQDAERGVGDYLPIFVPWFWQDEYRRKVPKDFELEPGEVDYMEAYKIGHECMVWRRGKIENDFRSDLSAFDQEYPAAPHLAFQKRSTEPFIPYSLIWESRKRDEIDALGPKIMGVDPAEYGDDDTCIAYRQGRDGRANKDTNCNGYDRWHGLGPMEVVGRVARKADDWGPDMINVDATGIGSGVADRLRELGYPCNRIIFGERAMNNEQYGIVRDEVWGDSKIWLEDKPNRLPDEDAMQSDATGPTYTYDSSRRLKMETKEKMKKRGLKSPDGWEAFALTHAIRTSSMANSSRDKAALRELGTRSWR